MSPKHKLSRNYHVAKLESCRVNSTHEIKEESTMLKTIVLGFANLEDTSNLLIAQFTVSFSFDKLVLV